MARFIDADELLIKSKKLMEQITVALGSMWLGAREVVDLIESAPTADVAEVKHGHWKDRYGNKYDNHLYECSECFNKAPCERYIDELGHTQTRQVLTDYCPNCGAKMDE